MSDISTQTGTLVVPRIGGSAPIHLELRETSYAESRLSDIAVLNSASYPDLTSAFTKGLAELVRAMGAISLESAKIKRALDQRHSYLIIYEVPKFLSNNKLKDSVDLRLAVIKQDDEYANLSELKDTYDSVFENLKIRFKTLEHALYGCSSIIKSKNAFMNKTDDFTNAEFQAGQSVYRR